MAMIFTSLFATLYIGSSVAQYQVTVENKHLILWQKIKQMQIGKGMIEAKF